MNRIFHFFPNAEINEAAFLDSLLKDKSDDEVRNFISVYCARRKDPQLILLTALLGFLGFAGIHRFMINQVGMGLLYFFTGGLCLIGTIVDLVNHKSLAFEYNQRMAMEIKAMLR